jgi:hypothetical protein
LELGVQSSAPVPLAIAQEARAWRHDEASAGERLLELRRRNAGDLAGVDNACQRVEARRAALASVMPDMSRLQQSMFDVERATDGTLEQMHADVLAMRQVLSSLRVIERTLP